MPFFPAACYLSFRSNGKIKKSIPIWSFSFCTTVNDGSQARIREHSRGREITIFNTALIRLSNQIMADFAAQLHPFSFPSSVLITPQINLQAFILLDVPRAPITAPTLSLNPPCAAPGRVLISLSSLRLQSHHQLAASAIIVYHLRRVSLFQHCAHQLFWELDRVPIPAKLRWNDY